MINQEKIERSNIEILDDWRKSLSDDKIVRILIKMKLNYGLKSNDLLSFNFNPAKLKFTKYANQTPGTTFGEFIFKLNFSKQEVRDKRLIYQSKSKWAKMFHLAIDEGICEYQVMCEKIALGDLDGRPVYLSGQIMLRDIPSNVLHKVMPLDNRLFKCSDDDILLFFNKYRLEKFFSSKANEFKGVLSLGEYDMLSNTILSDHALRILTEMLPELKFDINLASDKIISRINEEINKCKGNFYSSLFLLGGNLPKQLRFLLEYATKTENQSCIKRLKNSLRDVERVQNNLLIVC